MLVNDVVGFLVGEFDGGEVNDSEWRGRKKVLEFSACFHIFLRSHYLQQPLNSLPKLPGILPASNRE
jgi:hypothetical protein